MATCHYLFVLMIGAVLGSGQTIAGSDNYQAAVTAAARELTRQVEALQWALPAEDPDASTGRGLFNQSEAIQLGLIGLRQQIRKSGPMHHARSCT